MLKKYLIYSLFTFVGFIGADSLTTYDETDSSRNYTKPQIATGTGFTKANTRPTYEQSEKSAAVCFVTKTGNKYHKGNCSYLKYSKIGLGLARAQSQGYTACSRCLPNSNNLKTEKTQVTNYSYSRTDNSRRATSVQCNGTTQKGRRCRNRTKNSSGYCHHHN